VVVADDSVDGLYHVAPRQMELLAYYAHAIAHLDAAADPASTEAASGSDTAASEPAFMDVSRVLS
jgi:hypothetical protein